MRAIDKVITPYGVFQRWGIKKAAVCEACRKGWVLARKEGKNWIIDLEDAKARWGKKD
jgi:hypothetical protein